MIGAAYQRLTASTSFIAMCRHLWAGQHRTAPETSENDWDQSNNVSEN